MVVVVVVCVCVGGGGCFALVTFTYFCNLKFYEDMGV